MSIALQILNIALCIFMAKLDANTIKRFREPNHWLNFLIHAAMSAFGWIVFGWTIGIVILAESRLIFDSFLNLFRNLSLDYVSLRPKSFIDRIEKWVFKNNGLLPKIIYLALSIILNFL